MSEYMLAGQQSELERLRLQAEVWEPSAGSLLAQLGDGSGLTVLDVGCGALGWLRVLSEWVGPSGTVVGTDVDDALLDAARSDAPANVELRRDDLFATMLEPGSFDLVHARFMLAPIGRMDEQLVAYRGLVRPGGTIALEEPDTASWRHHPPAAAAERLIALVRDAFAAAGGDFDAGTLLPELMRRHALEPQVRADILALPPLHPYMRLPLQFATSLRPRLATLVAEDELDGLIADAQAELADPERWATTFTLIQAWARLEG